MLEKTSEWDTETSCVFVPTCLRSFTGQFLDSAQAPLAPHALGTSTARKASPSAPISSTSCKVAELLADFLIYLYTSPWTGKGKGKVLIYGFFFLSFPSTSLLWWHVSLATQAVSIYQHRGGSTTCHLLNAESCPKLFA